MKDCNSCGKCCTKYSDGGLSATKEEIENWEAYRPDITRYVSQGKIWMDPDTGAQLTLCPWLKEVPNKNKFSCDIYEDRPEDCRYYPATLSDMINDECEMLELSDFYNKKHAQKVLDNLMSDSR